MFSPHCGHADAGALEAVCAEVAARADRSAQEGPWRSGCVDELARCGALAGFIPADCGGTAAGEGALLELLAAIAARCLTTALALSQWASACRIIAGADAPLRAARLPPLARGEAWTTVGVSQLSTSRRHLGSPTLAASCGGEGWRLSGLCPWVTGADSSDTIVTGGISEAGQPVFFVVPTDAPGLSIAPPLRMLALSGSRTAQVVFRDVPCTETIRAPEGGVRTGGLATTALAIGATRAAIAAVMEEARARPALAAVAGGLRNEADELWSLLAAAAAGAATVKGDHLRVRANGLVTRAAQAALTASKGAGFVVGHPAERLAREAMFFLVWSCPQSVSAAVMCELAGLDPAGEHGHPGAAPA